MDALVISRSVLKFDFNPVLVASKLRWSAGVGGLSNTNQRLAVERAPLKSLFEPPYLKYALVLTQWIRKLAKELCFYSFGLKLQQNYKRTLARIAILPDRTKQSRRHRSRVSWRCVHLANRYHLQAKNASSGNFGNYLICKMSDWSFGTIGQLRSGGFMAALSASGSTYAGRS